MTERRRFIVKAGGAMAAVAAAAIVDAPNVIAQPKVQWRMSTAWTQAAIDVPQGAAQRLAKIVEETSGGRFRIEVFPGGQIMPPLDCFDAASQGTIEALSWPGRSTGTTKEPRVRVVHDRPVRHELRGHGGLVPPGRRAQALGGDVRRLQPRAAPGPSERPRRWPDGSGRRSPRSATTRGSRCACRASAARSSPGRAARRCLLRARDLRRARARRDRRLRMDRAARRHEARSPQDRALLLLPWLARARHHATSSASTRRRTRRFRSICGGRSTMPPPPCRSMASRTSTRRTRSRSSDSRRSSRARSRLSSSRCRCCAISRSWRPRSSGKNPRRPHGQEGARVLHEVPGAGGSLGPRRRRRLPSVRGRVTTGDR